MSNKDMALRFLECLGAYDESIAELLADDFQWVTMCGKPEISPLKGSKDKKQTVESLAGLCALMPEGLKFNIVSATAEENRVSVEAESYGKVTNGNPVSDVYNNAYHFIFYFENGLIREMREYGDMYYAAAILGG